MILTGEDFVPQEISDNTWEHFQTVATQRKEIGNGYCGTLDTEQYTARTIKFKIPIGQRLSNQVRMQGLVRCVGQGIAVAEGQQLEV